MKNKKIVVLACVLLAVLIAGCVSNEAQDNSPAPDEGISTSPYEGKKILFVDSYHEGYEWSDGVTKGINDNLKDTGVELKIYRMDTKRNDTAEFGKQSALRAKAAMEEFKPDVVIACDDPAFKYLIMPYYKDASLPVVFCGINWDASIYGAPYSNTAGMIEISMAPQVIPFLKNYTKGERIGFIAGNTTTDIKNAQYYTKLYNITFTKIYHANTFDEWKSEFLALQSETDITILENNAGIKGWDNTQAEYFVLKNSKIPMGGTQAWMANYSLITFAKVPQEQGEWSAKTALRILEGTKPSDIPIVTNQRGKLYANQKIANRLGVLLSPYFLNNAEIIR